MTDCVSRRGPPLLRRAVRPVLRPACPGAGWESSQAVPMAGPQLRLLCLAWSGGVFVSPCIGPCAPGRRGLTYHPALNSSNVHRPSSMSQTPAPDLAATWNRLAQKVADQHWPASALYVVATPIGNLGDLSLRAWQALTRCDVIAAEDTRASRALLDAWGVSTPLIAAHRHNEAGAAQAVLGRLQKGERVAL